MIAAAPELSVRLTKTRYYRPELDILRLIAFASVFITHGPRLAHGYSPGRQWFATIYNYWAQGCVYGLCLFFFLSAYLITELLLREKRKTGTIHLRWFYIRRILRIWPLYYLAIAIAYWVVPRWLPGTALTYRELVCLVLFIGYWKVSFSGTPFDILWSISVEELFYAVWPLLARQSTAFLRRACFLIGLGSLVLAMCIADNWFNPLVQFFYFAAGCWLALSETSELAERPSGWRVILFLLGFVLWSLPWWLLPFHLIMPILHLLQGVSALAGCLCLFYALRGWQVPSTKLWKALLYLGRISYGLYVFHMLAYRLVEHYLPHMYGPLTVNRLLLKQSTALEITVVIATITFFAWERPFLRLKDQYAPIQTRPSL